MSIPEKKLNQDINELQRFVHDTRKQSIYSQSNRSNFSFANYENILVSLQQFFRSLRRLPQRLQFPDRDLAWREPIPSPSQCQPVALLQNETLLV